MSDQPAAGEGEHRAYWSGYTPGKENPDPVARLTTPMVPLTPDELRAEAARFRHGAERADERGDAVSAERLRRAADAFEQRGNESA